MSSKLVYDDDDYSDVSNDDYSDEIAQDNINALQSHGWHEGQACLLYVHPDGTLGHCNPIVNLPYILMGTALVVLILYHILNTVHRLYRRKSIICPPLLHSEFLIALNILFNDITPFTLKSNS